MANYYDVLKVDPKATGPEIKSAYRRLARKLHPDKNRGVEDTARRFAEIAEAYEVLSNAKERANYDRRILDAQFSGDGDSVFTSTNRHARRWRQMVYEKRYNDIIDRMIAEERREAMAYQKVVYPLTAFLVASLLSTAFKPKMFVNSEMLGKIIITSLFVIGVIHIIGRIRDGFVRYTEFDDNIHDSILDDSTRKQAYPRYAVAAMLLVSFLACLGIGLVIGLFIDFPANIFPEAFAPALKPEFIFYPPIVTVFVDMAHSIAVRFVR